ncbi:hypothetical protein ACJMK2_043819 [Sinanodonta woodiana]|uniref:Uncharacterized protein n=1 Tax=Sinanodonta woodiana TaxID=1069815 RepID=A0ABD3VY22_SINWO
MNIMMLIFTLRLVPSCAKNCASLTNTLTPEFGCEDDLGHHQDDHWNPGIVFGTVLGSLAALLGLMTCTVFIIKACNHKKMRTGIADVRASDMPERSNPRQNVNHHFTSVILPPPYLDKPPPYMISEGANTPTAEHIQLSNPTLHARCSDLIPVQQQPGRSRDSRQRPQSAVSIPPPYTEMVPTMEKPPQDTSRTYNDHIRC